MDILKLCGFCLISVILFTLIKQYKPEYALLFTVGSCFLIAVYTFTSLSPYLKLLPVFANENAVVAIKALGVGIITELFANIAKDEGMGALSFSIGIAGKTALLILSLPLIIKLIDTAVGLC